jgi:hypothetical protein
MPGYGCAGETVCPSLSVHLADLGGKGRILGYGFSLAGSHGARVIICVVAAVTVEDCPGDAGELVGECRGKNVAVQPNRGCCEPAAEAVFRPACLAEQHGSRSLDEQVSQVSVSPSADPAEDCSVAGGARPVHAITVGAMGRLGNPQKSAILGSTKLKV